MSDIVGIDLGTTNSLIGVMDAGFPILLADANGERLTPSVVHFPRAVENRSLDELPRGCARSSRRTPSTPSNASSACAVTSCGTTMRMSSYELVRAKGQPVRVKAAGREHSPEEISALVLRKLKADAEAALGRDVSRAVITVPAYFNDAQRTAHETGRRTGRLHRRADR